MSGRMKSGATASVTSRDLNVQAIVIPKAVPTYAACPISTE